MCSRSRKKERKKKKKKKKKKERKKERRKKQRIDPWWLCKLCVAMSFNGSSLSTSPSPSKTSNGKFLMPSSPSRFWFHFHSLFLICIESEELKKESEIDQKFSLSLHESTLLPQLIAETSRLCTLQFSRNSWLCPHGCQNSWNNC